MVYDDGTWVVLSWSSGSWVAIEQILLYLVWLSRASLCVSLATWNSETRRMGSPSSAYVIAKCAFGRTGPFDPRGSRVLRVSATMARVSSSKSLLPSRVHAIPAVVDVASHATSRNPRSRMAWQS